jgi:hypothetical protein
MKKTNKDVKQTITNNSSIIKKTGRGIKEVVPPTVTKNIRDIFVIKPAEMNINKRNYEPYATPSNLPQDWPSEDEVKVTSHFYYLGIQLPYR